MMSGANYENWTKGQEQSHHMRQDYLRKMQQLGQQLSEADLKAIDEPMPQLPDRDHWLKDEVLSGQPDSVVALFGTKLEQYLSYYERNLEYLKPGIKPYTFEVDEDVRSLAMPNRSVELLELCVAMLESNIEAEKAGHILERYTGEKFQSAAEWRRWLNSRRGKLYFSDVDGFKFHSAP